MEDKGRSSEITIDQQWSRYAGEVETVHPWDRPFAPGTKSDHETGVSFTAPWEDPFSGFPTHARRCALALHGAGLPVHLRSLNPNNQWDVGAGRDVARAEVEHLLSTSIGQYTAQIHMIVPSLEGIAALLSHPWMTKEQLEAVNSRRILYSVWERSTIEPEYAPMLNKMGQVWVSTEYSRGVLERAGVEPSKLRVVPCPCRDDDPLQALRGRKRLPGPTRFYHIGKWEPRKAQDNIIGAFMLAFRPGEAILMLKTSLSSPKKIAPYPESPAHSIALWLADERVKENGWTAENVDKGVKVMRHAFTAKQMQQLHSTGDVYVTLSRGEGWDMPAFDAKLAGNKMVYTPSGGPQEFASPTDVRVGCMDAAGKQMMVPCHPFYGWSGSEYLDYNLDEAKNALRMAASTAAVGDYGSTWRSNPVTVGYKMRTYVEELTVAAS